MKLKFSSLLPLVALLLSCVISYASEATLPEPTVSKYLTTTMASFLLNFKEMNVKYMLEFEASSAPLYLITEFEDPTGGASKTVYSKISKDEKSVAIESPPFDNAQNLKKYKTTTKIYSDEEYSELLDTHVQYILFQKPPM